MTRIIPAVSRARLAGASHAQSPALRLGVVDLDEGDGLVQLSRDYKETPVEAIRLGYAKLREQLVASRRAKVRVSS